MSDPFFIFTKYDTTILKRLSRDDNISIAKANKGCCIVLLNKAYYHQKLFNIINELVKCEEIHVEEKKLLIELEDKINKTLRSLKAEGNISEAFNNYCYLSGSQLGNSNSLLKVHKNKYPVTSNRCGI